MRCSTPSCPNNGELKCSRCSSAFYCGRQCQRDHWSVHKLVCKKKEEEGGPAPQKSEEGVEDGPSRLYTGMKLLASSGRCEKCDKKTGYSVCGGCRKVAYCSSDCHQEHFPEHREECFQTILARIENGDVHKDDIGSDEMNIPVFYTG